MAISSAHEQEERGDDQHEAKEDAPDQQEGAQLIVGDSGVLRERELRSAGPTGRGGREQAGLTMLRPARFPDASVIADAVFLAIPERFALK